MDDRLRKWQVPTGVRHRVSRVLYFAHGEFSVTASSGFQSGCHLTLRPSERAGLRPCRNHRL